MRVRNSTPHAHIIYGNEDAEGRLFDILIVKQSYHLNDAMQLCPSPEQEPINFTDYCFEDFNTSSLRYPSDLVPYKPNAEISIIADSFALDGAAQSWTCGFEVEGKAQTLRKQLRVHGARCWRPEWRLTAASPAERISLRYELAFGGTQNDRDGKVLAFEANPLGRGWIDRKLTDRSKSVPAPQIEYASTAIRDPFEIYESAGLGPIPPAWLPRRPLGGTFDTDWVEQRWPHWPPDYSFAYHLSAPADQRWKGFFSGNETIRLHALRPEAAEIAFRLPGQCVGARLHAASGWQGTVRANLDTIYMDLTADDPEDCLISLVSRLTFLEGDIETFEIVTGAYDAFDLVAGHPADLFKQEVAHV